MADLTQNISNTIGVFGLAKTTQWGNFNWGEANWGEGTEGMYKSIDKYIPNSFSMSDVISKNQGKFISNNLNPTEDLIEQQLTDGSGYNYVFDNNKIDGEDRYFPDWNELGQSASTWTCQNVSSSDWSEL